MPAGTRLKGDTLKLETYLFYTTTMINKLIINNTIFLYVRTIISIIISLFTTRIVLEKLGVNDYGLYQVVGGIASMICYIINGPLAMSSSRFITYEIGRNNGTERLKTVFSSLFFVHVLIGLFVILIAETIGLWVLYNKINIPTDRFEAALFTYQLSIITTFIGITQVPYTATIIGHEKINIYAYTSIIDVIIKLLIVYLLGVSNWDRLKLYSLLLFLLQFFLTIYYRYYCNNKFKESRLCFIFDKKIIRNITSFSGWNLIENTSISLNSQGVIILLNMFFNSTIVTSRTVANTISMTAYSFINNLRTASNPQIIKKYANKEFDESKKLLLETTALSFYLMLFIGVPVTLVSKELLLLWLGQLPLYSEIFLVFAIITSFISVFDQSFYTAFVATGKIKRTTLYSVLIGYISIFVIYICFKLGFSPVSLCWVMLFSAIINSLIIKPYLLIKYENYTRIEILKLVINCFRVGIVAYLIPLIFYFYSSCLFNTLIVKFLLISIISIASTALSIWFLGLDIELRKVIINKIFRKRK